MKTQFSFSAWFVQLLGKLGENHLFCGLDLVLVSDVEGYIQACLVDQCWVAPVFTSRYNNIPHMQGRKTISKGSRLEFGISSEFWRFSSLWEVLWNAIVHPKSPYLILFWLRYGISSRVLQSWWLFIKSRIQQCKKICLLVNDDATNICITIYQRKVAWNIEEEEKHKYGTLWCRFSTVRCSVPFYGNLNQLRQTKTSEYH